MRILLALLFIGLTVAAFATGPIRTLAEETMTPGTAEVSAPMHVVPPSESCLSPADLREAVADKRVIEPVAAIRAARTVISGPRSSAPGSAGTGRASPIS